MLTPVKSCYGATHHMLALQRPLSVMGYHADANLLASAALCNPAASCVLDGSGRTVDLGMLLNECRQS